MSPPHPTRLPAAPPAASASLAAGGCWRLAETRPEESRGHRHAGRGELRGQIRRTEEMSGGRRVLLCRLNAQRFGRVGVK